MKLLRETVRKLLLENNDHFEKIAVMLCTGDLSTINQAIELAEALDYAHRVEYKTFGLGGSYHTGTTQKGHRWTFSVVKPLEAIIIKEWDNTSVHNHRFGTFVIYPTRNHSIGIKLVEVIK